MILFTGEQTDKETDGERDCDGQWTVNYVYIERQPPQNSA